MNNLITSTKEDLDKRTTQLMVRFSVEMARFQYRNPAYMIQEGLENKAEYFAFLTKRFIEQDGIN